MLSWRFHTLTVMILKLKPYLHRRALKHPEWIAMLKILHKGIYGNTLQADNKKKLDLIRCLDSSLALEHLRRVKSAVS